MKKFAILMAAVTLTGTLAFAEDPALKVSGYVNSGIKIVTDTDVSDKVLDDADVGTTFQSYANDWGTAGTLGTIGIELAGEKAGFNLTITVASEDGVGTDTAYGWVKPLEGLTLFGGTSYDGSFDGLDDQSNDYFSNNGVSATYSVAGLTVGAGTVITETASAQHDFTLGAGYSLDGVGKFRVSAVTLGDELEKTGVTTSISAVPGLTLAGGYWAESLSTDKNDWLDVTVGYKISDALAARVIAYDYLTSEYFAVTPRVTYTVDPTLSLYGQVQVKTESGDEALATKYYSTSVPRVAVTFKPDASAQIFGYVQYDLTDAAATFLVDFKYSF